MAENLTDDNLTESDWETLLQRIYDGECTPFIGAGACKGVLPLAKDIAKEWAITYNYPLDDKEDLTRVAQFLAIEKDPIVPKKDIQKRFNVSPPDFSRPDEPHALLADLPLPIYVTTNYDDFMIEALKVRKRDPQREFCRWNKFIEKRPPSVFGDKNNRTGYDPSPANPLVYHLHGHCDFLQSMVLTENDYLEFLVNLSKDTELLPTRVQGAFASTSLLFLGYSLSDWNFRVLFRTLVGSLGSDLGYTSVAVQLAPSPGDKSKESQEKAQKYLDKYFENLQNVKVKVYWGDIRDFTKELRERWEKFKNEQK